MNNDLTTSSIEEFCSIYLALLKEGNKIRNISKIEALFRNWIYEAYWYYTREGEDALRLLETALNQENVTLHFALQRMVYKLKEEGNNAAPSSISNTISQSAINKAIRRLIVFLYLKFGKNILVFAGGQNIYHKYISLVSGLVLKYLDEKKHSINSSFFNYFCKKVESKYPQSTDVFLDFCLRNLPKEFFPDSPYILPNRKNDIVILASPTLFLTVKSSLNLLFTNSKITLVGLQHGCNFGVFHNNRIERLEKQIADVFYYWYFGTDPICVNRFSKKIDINKKLEDYVFVWIGRAEVNNFLESQIPPLKDHLESKRTIDQIALTLETGHNDSVIIPHLNNSTSAVSRSYPTRNIFRPQSKIENYIIQERHILIFDVLMSTTIYYALFSRTPFLIYCERFEPDETTSMFDEFVEQLRKENILFYTDEVSGFSHEVYKYRTNNDYHSIKRKSLDYMVNVLESNCIDVKEVCENYIKNGN